MNKLIITALLIMSAFSLKAQDSTAVKNGKPAIYWLFHNNYMAATRYNDYDQAKSALYSLINLEPDNDSLKFNLAYLYFDTQKYPSAILVSLDVLADNPQYAPALEICAISFENLGIKEKALANYEKLYVATENLETLYKVMYLQLDLKRYGECLVNTDILINDPASLSQKIVMQVSDKEQKEFPLQAAGYNIRGLVKLAQGDKSGAKNDFNKALEIAPDFVFATENLADLNK